MSSSGPESKDNSEDKKVNGKEDAASPEKSDNTPAATRGPSTSDLMTGIVVNSCDILIPGWILGWIPVSFLTVGATSMLSTILVGRSKWAAAQRKR